MKLSLNITTQGALLDGKAPHIIQGNLDRFVTSVTIFLLQEVQKRTPQGVYGAQGGLLGSIQANVSGKGTPIVKGVVMSAQKYAEIVEKGRTAGKGMPPEGMLLGWIVKKLGLSYEAAQKIEFVIRRKIGAHGFEGRHMFEKALTENLGRIETMATAAGLTIATELS